jgi:carbonic anhydrase
MQQMISICLDQRHRLLRLPLALFIAMGGADAYAWQPDFSGAQDLSARWSHSGDDGPQHWGELSPEFVACATGRLQSPVPLGAAEATAAPCQPLRFRYRSSALYLTNDGQALRLGYDRGSYLVIDGLSYELAELRFHVPAEHVVDGRVADGELQFIHGNNRGDLAIVAVPLVAGTRVNQIMRRMIEHAPSVAGEQFYGRNIGINALFLLPGRKHYYSYPGSLTRPPCTEGVRWYVLRDALEVELGDLRRLAQLVGPNARPLQPLDGRMVTKVCEPQ